MKRTILILTALMLLSVAQGQFQTPPFEEYNEANKNFFFGGDTIKGSNNIIISCFINRDELRHIYYEIKLRQEYEAECYADSTFSYDSFVYVEETMNGYIYKTKSVWTHRIPTFVGYTKWLREKLTLDN